MARIRCAWVDLFLPVPKCTLEAHTTISFCYKEKKILTKTFFIFLYQNDLTVINLRCQAPSCYASNWTLKKPPRQRKNNQSRMEGYRVMANVCLFHQPLEKGKKKISIPHLRTTGHKSCSWGFRGDAELATFLLDMQVHHLFFFLIAHYKKKMNLISISGFVTRHYE